MPSFDGTPDAPSWNLRLKQARILSVFTDANGNNAYTWVEVVPDPTAPGGYLDAVSGASDYVKITPAYEENNTLLADFPFYTTLFPRTSTAYGDLYTFSAPQTTSSVAVQLYGDGGTHLGSAANADGSLLFQDAEGDLSQDEPGCFFYDADGTLGPLESPETLYIGGSDSGANGGLIALYDTVLGSFGFIQVYDGTFLLGSDGDATGANLEVGGFVAVGGTIDSYVAPKPGVGGSISGNLSIYEVFLGTSYKKTVLYLAALTGTATYAFSGAWTVLPGIVATSAVAASVVTSLSITSVTITGSGQTGFIFLEGF
jgi:hypothetical protein